MAMNYPEWNAHMAVTDGKLSGGEFAHQPDERRFVNWLIGSDESLNAIHLHTLNTVRHGLTIVQKKANLRGIDV